MRRFRRLAPCSGRRLTPVSDRRGSGVIWRISHRRAFRGHARQAALALRQFHRFLFARAMRRRIHRPAQRAESPPPLGRACSRAKRCAGRCGGGGCPSGAADLRSSCFMRGLRISEWWPPASGAGPAPAPAHSRARVQGAPRAPAPRALKALKAISLETPKSRSAGCFPRAGERHLTRQSAASSSRRWLKAASSRAPFAPCVRHAYASICWLMAPIYGASRACLARHIATTEIYTHIEADRLRKTVERHRSPKEGSKDEDEKLRLRSLHPSTFILVLSRI